MKTELLLALEQLEKEKGLEINMLFDVIEDAVVKFSVEHPHLGQQKVAIKLTEALGIDISAGGVRSMWLRNNLNTTALRVARSQAL